MITKKPYFICIDFDGTLVENKFPEIGDLRQDIYDRLQQRKKELEYDGYQVYIILWTCRSSESLEDAISFLKENNVQFDFVNENPILKLNSNKVYANEYWDDRSVYIEPLNILERILPKTILNYNSNVFISEELRDPKICIYLHSYENEFFSSLNILKDKIYNNYKIYNRHNLHSVINLKIKSIDIFPNIIIHMEYDKIEIDEIDLKKDIFYQLLLNHNRTTIKITKQIIKSDYNIFCINISTMSNNNETFKESFFLNEKTFYIDVQFMVDCINFFFLKKKPTIDLIDHDCYLLNLIKYQMENLFFDSFEIKNVDDKYSIELKYDDTKSIKVIGSNLDKCLKTFLNVILDDTIQNKYIEVTD